MESKADIVRKYIKDSRDWMPTKSLARLIYNDNKLVWKDEEACRNAVRYVRGNKGDKARDYVKKKEYFRESGKQGDFYFPIPEPLKEFEDWKIVNITAKNILLLPDLQIPFHEKAPIEIAIKYGLDNGADTIILNGDVFDMYSLSKFSRDPRLRNFKLERDIGLHFLDSLRETFPNAKIIFKYGNHDERLQAYIWHKAEELYGVKEITELESLYRFNDFEIEVVNNKQPIKTGHLFIIHGHEFGGGISVPVNPARTFFLKAKTCVIGSHHHVKSEHSVKDLNQDVIASWSTGCLCNLHPRYRPINEWTHGFAFIRMTDKMNFKVDNLKIIDGEIY